jgi:OOP family OmpA-OmpF porin
MSRKRTIATLTAFGLAALAAAGGAWLAAGRVEGRSSEAVRRALDLAGLDWAEVQTDGLQLILTGTAPDEPARFRAITQAGEAVDPGRVIDAMDVVETGPAAAPRFSVSLLRNEAGISAIGLVPGAEGEALLGDLLEPLGTGTRVSNMVETADYETPDGWEAAIRFAVEVIEDLPRSKLVVAPGHISVTAVADSAEARTRIETALTRARPDEVTLALDIAAPRPVVTPFALRFAMPADGPPRFDACAVDSETARDRIVAAAAEVGFEGKADCVLALGVPSQSWGAAVVSGIEALSEAGGGTLTFSDADVALRGLRGVDPATFERVAAELETALPDIFSLTATLPPPEVEDGDAPTGDGPPEFTATLAPEGRVQLRGRLFDEAQEDAVLAYGRALFGVEETYIATREDEGVPEGWPVRVLAGLDALSELAQGAVVVRPSEIDVSGITGNPQAEAEISGRLAAVLGPEAALEIDVVYDEELDPALNIPTPEECETRLNAVLIEQKLSFAPGEAVIDESGEVQLEALAELLELCKRAAFEIGGHTDSQGREVMNLELSQERADAVRTALIERSVPPSQIVAVGYGEAEPVADNSTEAGREANRRITFTLLGRRELPERALVREAAAAAAEAAEEAQPDSTADPEEPSE